MVTMLSWDEEESVSEGVTPPLKSIFNNEKEIFLNEISNLLLQSRSTLSTKTISSKGSFLKQGYSAIQSIH